MVDVHWMLYFLFGTLVAAILAVLLGTFTYCHEGGRKHQRAGWWAGVTLAVLVFADSAHRFSSLPFNGDRVDVARLVGESVRVSWIVALITALLCASAVWLLDSIKMPEKGIAFGMMLASFSSLYAFVHVFWIRTANALLFSSFIGCCLGYLLYRAFLRTSVEKPDTPVKLGMAR